MKPLANAVKDRNPFVRFLVWGRIIICPFEKLVDALPNNAHMFDIGSGVGLWPACAWISGKVSSITACDSNSKAIQEAQSLLQKLAVPTTAISLHVTRHSTEWPKKLFNVVSMIDVIHHIPATEQERFFKQAVQHLLPGGTFIYKDMVSKPFWLAWSNRLHDLILARQWIQYRSADDVVTWAQAEGLQLTSRLYQRILWYGHELLVFTKPTNTNEGGATS